MGQHIGYQQIRLVAGIRNGLVGSQKGVLMELSLVVKSHQCSCNGCHLGDGSQIVNIIIIHGAFLHIGMVTVGAMPNHFSSAGNQYLAAWHGLFLQGMHDNLFHLQQGIGI